MSTILIILVLIFLFGGGGYYAHGRYGGSGLGGVLGLLLLALVVLWLVGGLGGLESEALTTPGRSTTGTAEGRKPPNVSTAIARCVSASYRLRLS